jgi:hypothetical protein
MTEFQPKRSSIRLKTGQLERLRCRQSSHSNPVRTRPLQTLDSELLSSSSACTNSEGSHSRILDDSNLTHGNKIKRQPLKLFDAYVFVAGLAWTCVMQSSREYRHRSAMLTQKNSIPD